MNIEPHRSSVFILNCGVDGNDNENIEWNWIFVNRLRKCTLV